MFYGMSANEFEQFIEVTKELFEKEQYGTFMDVMIYVIRILFYMLYDIRSCSDNNGLSRKTQFCNQLKCF